QQLLLDGSNGTLFFTYSDVPHGNELWTIPNAAPPRQPAGFTAQVQQTAATITPAAITAARAAAAATSPVQLRWTRGADMNGYWIDRSTVPDFSTIDATFSVPANLSGYTDTTALAGVNYYYRLMAYNP